MFFEIQRLTSLLHLRCWRRRPYGSSGSDSGPGATARKHLTILLTKPIPKIIKTLMKISTKKMNYIF